MDRRLALGVLWALFAAASVGVGFGAAGLVGDPFTDPAGVSTGSVVSSSGSATASPATSSSSPGSPARTEGTEEPSGQATSRPSSRTPSATRSSSPATVARGVSTRGGYVSASCRSGLVSVSASPSVGWSIDDIDSGRVENARVRFEGSDDSDQRVEVRAYCASGVPRFAVEDRDHGGGDDDGGGSGSSGSGSSGSGGGDD